MRKFMVLAGCAVAGLSGAALADTRATEAENLARFEQFASAPVDNFTMWKMYQFQLLGPDTVAVWSGVNDVYMLKVEQPCINLENAKAIVVTSKMQHQVNKKLDFVNFGSQRCQILEIHPIDYKAMKAGGPANKG